MEQEQIMMLRRRMGAERVERYGMLIQRLNAALADKNMETVISLVELNPEIMSYGLELLYPGLADEEKYRLSIACYINHGDHFPVVRKYVRQARKFMPMEKRIPPELQDMPEIEIYRAGDEPVEAARNRISWTTDPEMASWFRERAACLQQQERRIYKGLIKPDKIIHYTDDREEREVMQYRSVYDVVEVG